MKNDFYIRTQPYLSLNVAIDRRIGHIDNKTIQLIFSLKNVGQVPLIYSNEELEIKGVSINPLKSNFVLFPEQTTSIYSNMVIIHSLNEFGQNEKGKIKILFWTHADPSKKYFFQRYFILIGHQETFIDSDEFGVIS